MQYPEVYGSFRYEHVGEQGDEHRENEKFSPPYEISPAEIVFSVLIADISRNSRQEDENRGYSSWKDK